jgi:hypothetical protein
MAKHEIRIIPKHREEIDTARLAEALLDLIDHLTPKERARLAAEGDRILKKTAGMSKPKGSAA